MVKQKPFPLYNQSFIKHKNILNVQTSCSFDKKSFPQLIHLTFFSPHHHIPKKIFWNSHHTVYYLPPPVAPRKKERKKIARGQHEIYQTNSPNTENDLDFHGISFFLNLTIIQVSMFLPFLEQHPSQRFPNNIICDIIYFNFII